MALRDGDRARVEALLRTRDDRAAEHVEDVGWGTILTTPSLPDVWDLNHVRVEDPAADPARAVALAEERGLPKVLWETAPPGGPPRGRPTREVVMLHRRPPDRAEPGAEVVELGPRDRDDICSAVLLDDPDRAPFAPRLLAAHRRWHRAVETVALGVRAADGTLAGQAWLYRHDGAAQIEDVNILSAHRGAGLGRALVAGALARVRAHELCFILADATDWPQLLYDRLGFDETWTRGGALLGPGVADG